MRKLRKVIRCMAYKKGDLYIAICLDLSLAAQANTMQEAMQKMEAQIDDYLNEVRQEPQYALQLLNRPAPFSQWLKYYWLKFESILSGNKKGSAFFEEDCYA